MGAEPLQLVLDEAAVVDPLAEQPNAGVHIDTLVDQLVAKVEAARVLPAVSFDGGVGVGVEVKI